MELLLAALVAAQTAVVQTPVASWKGEGGELAAWDCVTSIDGAGAWSRECTYYNRTKTKSCKGAPAPESLAVAAALKHADVLAAARKGRGYYGAGPGGNSMTNGRRFSIAGTAITVFPRCPNLGGTPCLPVTPGLAALDAAADKLDELIYADPSCD